MNRIPMTVYGSELLHAELKKLKSEERPRIIKAIEEARAHGDLKENAEYHAAKEQQGFIEGRIKEIQGKLSHAQVIDVTTMKNDGIVIFGATVRLINMDNEERVTYKIVGDDEANIKEGKISVSSPIARAVIRKQVGDEVEVNAPSGFIYYEVEEILYI